MSQHPLPRAQLLACHVLYSSPLPSTLSECSPTPWLLQSDFTPFRIALSAANRTFSCSAAYQDFGYVPKVSIAHSHENAVLPSRR